MEPTDATEPAAPGWWARVRAAGLLLGLLAVVGAVTALVIGAVTLAGVTVLDRALG